MQRAKPGSTKGSSSGTRSRRLKPRKTSQHDLSSQSKLKTPFTHKPQLHNTIHTLSKKHFASKKELAKFDSLAEREAFDNAVVESLEPDLLGQIAAEMNLFTIQPYREHVMKLTEVSERLQFTALEQCALYDPSLTISDFHSYIDLRVHTHNTRRQKEFLKKQTEMDPDYVSAKITPPPPPNTYHHLRPHAWSLPPRLIPSFTENAVHEQTTLFNHISELSDLVHKYLFNYHHGERVIPPPHLTFENTILAYEQTTQRAQHCRISLNITAKHPDAEYRSLAARSKDRFGHMLRLEANNPTMRKVLLKYAASADAQNLSAEKRLLTANVVTSIFQACGLREFVYDDLVEDQQHKPGAIKYSQIAVFINRHMFLLDNLERGLSSFYDLSAKPGQSVAEQEQLLLDNQPAAKQQSTELTQYTGKSNKQLYDELKIVDNHLALKHPLHYKYNKLLHQQNLLMDAISQIEQTHNKLRTLLQDVTDLESISRHQQNAAVERLRGTLGHLMAWVDGNASIFQAASGIKMDISYFIASTMERLQDPGSLLKNTLAKFRHQPQSDVFAHHRPRPVMQLTLNELDGIPDRLLFEFQQRNAKYLTTKVGDPQSLMSKVVPMDDGTSHSGYRDTPSIVLGNSPEEYLAVMTFCHSDIVRYRYWLLFHHGSNNAYPEAMLPQLDTFRQTDLALLPNPSKINRADFDEKPSQMRAVDNLRHNNEYIAYEEDLFTIMLDTVISLRALLAATGERLNEVKHIMNQDLSAAVPDFDLKAQPKAGNMGDMYVDEESAQQGVYGEDLSGVHNNGSEKGRTTYLSLVAHESLLQTPENVQSFIAHITEIAKTAINDDDLDNPYTMTPHNLPTALHIKQRLFDHESTRGYRSADLVRFLSKRRQYLDAENKTKYTTDTLASMTTPSLTGYELDHEILRKEAFLQEQLNQVALTQIQLKQTTDQANDLDDMLKAVIDSVTPDGSTQTFFERFALEAGALFDQKQTHDSQVSQEVSQLKSKLQQHQQSVDKCRKQLADTYWDYLTTIMNPGILDLNQEDQDDLRTTISDQIIARIRPTITTLFPWERYYYGRLADASDPTLQGVGLEADLEELRLSERTAAQEVERLESEYTKQGIQESFHTSVHQANEHTDVNLIMNQEKVKKPSLPPWHPQARAQQGQQGQQSQQGQKTKDEQNTPKTPLAAINPQQLYQDPSQLTFLPPLPLQDFHMEMNSINLRRQHQVSTFNLPFDYTEVSSYLPLPYVLHNIIFIFEELFNIDIVQMPTQFQIHPSDRDTLKEFPSINNSHIHLPSIHNSIIHDVWQRDVLAFNVFDRGKRSDIDNKMNSGVFQNSEKAVLGQFYLDLFGRTGKGDSVETQFQGSAFNYITDRPATNKEVNTIDYILQPMRKQHSLQFFFDRFDDFMYSDKLVEKLTEIQAEIAKHESIIDDPEHETGIESKPDITQFSPDVFKTARTTIKQVGINHYKKMFTHIPKHTNHTKHTKHTNHTETQLVEKEKGSSGGVAEVETTVNRSPPTTVISFPLYETRILPPVHDVDNIVDKHYMEQIVNARRTGLPATILDTKTATALSNRATTILDHSAATLAELQEDKRQTFMDPLKDHFNNRRLKLTTLQNLPHLINKTKQPTAPVLLHVEDVKLLFHEFGHMIMHTLDHTPYLNSKALLNNQEIHELISHLAEQFLFHSHPNKPIVPEGYTGALPGAPPRHENSFQIKQEGEERAPADEISPLDSKLFELYKQIPLYGSLGTIHNLTQHYSYINHGDITHLHNLYHPDAQFVHKKYVHELSKLVFPQSKSTRISVLHGNSQSNYENKLDFRQFSSSLKYISNYYNTKNSPIWKQQLIEFDRNMTQLERSNTGPHAAQYNEAGLNHPLLQQTAEFGIINDKRSVTEIETTLKNTQKTSGRMIQPFTIDRLMYVALQQTDIEYDDRASAKHALLPWQMQDSIPSTDAERKKIRQKLYSRFPPKPPLSFYHNIMTREVMSEKQEKHENILDALVDHHLHMVEYLGDPENSGMVYDSDGEVDSDSGGADGDDDTLRIEDIPQSSRMKRKAMEATEYLQKRRELDQAKREAEAVAKIRNLEKEENQSQNQKHTAAALSSQAERIIDAALDIEDVPSTANKVDVNAENIVDVENENDLPKENVSPHPQAAKSDHSSQSTRSRPKVVSIDKDTLLVDDSAKQIVRKLETEQERTLSLQYFTNRVFNFDQFRSHFASHETPVVQLKKRPLSGKHAVVSQFTAAFSDKSKQIQDEILALQREQRKKSTLLFDRVRGLRETQIDSHQAKINQLPPQRRPVDLSLQQMKYQYLLPQFIFVHQNAQRYQLGLQQAQGTSSFSNNVFRTLQFLLQNPPSIIKDHNSLDVEDRVNDDALGLKMYPPATPTLPAYESVKTIAHNLDHLYSRYAGQLYAYPYAEMLSEELFESNFLAKSTHNIIYDANINLIQQQRLNSHRLAKDPAFNIPSDIQYELLYHDTIVRLSTTSPLTPNTPLYGLAKDQGDSEHNVDGASGRSDDARVEFLGPEAKIRPRPTATLPFGYYKSAYISKPSVAFVNQYFNKEKSQQFKDCLKTFEQHNVMEVLSQFSNHKGDDLLHFYNQPKI